MVLSMNDIHCRRACVDCLSENGFPLYLKHLSLFGYDIQNPPFLLADVLGYIRPCTLISTLRFDALELALSYSPPPEPILSLPPNLELVSMAGDIVAELVTLTGQDVVVRVMYTDCTPPSYSETPCRLINGVDELVFATFLSANALMWLLAATTGRTSSDELCFRNCDGLTREVFRVLERPIRLHAGTRHQCLWICPYMERLTVLGCTQFCSTDLRATLKARLRTYGHNGFGLAGDRCEVARVECLRVVGRCELDSRDRRWIHMYVQHTKWHSWVGGTSSTL